jgi:hypothetical protein
VTPVVQGPVMLALGCAGLAAGAGMQGEDISPLLRHCPYYTIEHLFVSSQKRALWRETTRQFGLHGAKVIDTAPGQEYSKGGRRT